MGIIYTIRNLQNNHQYVGSTGHPTKRWPQHQRKLRKNKHHAPHLQAAWNKYGETAFVFEILEEVPDTSQLWPREQVFITRLRPVYNVALVAGSPLGIKRSETTREKLRKSHTGVPLKEEHKQHIREALQGRIFTPEWAAKIQAAKLGKKRSPETCRRISESHRGLKRSPEAIQHAADAHRGTKRSLATRQRMSQAQRQLHIRQARSAYARLSWDDVLAIYQAYAQDNISFNVLARRYRISSSTIRKILHQKQQPPELCPDENIRQQLLQFTFNFRHHKTPSKLNWEIVCEIRQLYTTQDYSQSQLAKRFNVTRETIRDIVNNKRRTVCGNEGK
jgi:group I intron endonuclease